MKDYKSSYYNIFSDEVNQKGDSVVFNTRSTKTFLVNKTIRNFLENSTLSQIDDETFKVLKDNQFIVDNSENELDRIISENNSDIASSSNMLYEVIQPTAYCQLGCDYCGQKHKKDYLSDHLESLIIERITRKIEKGDFKKLHIGWFGGEPLVGLKNIRSITKKLNKTCKERGLNYTGKVVTNGLSLKKNIFLELVEQLNINSIEITLDGTAEYHDNVRHTKNKKSTFDIIFNNLIDIFNIESFEELGCRISIRCNVDHRNYLGVSPLIQKMKEHNFQNKIAYFYPIGIYSWGGNDAHTKSLSKEEFADMEIDWFIEMIEAGFAPSLLPGRVRQVCIVVSPDSEMYDAYGNVFNCTEVSYSDFYNNTPYTLGNLKFERTRIFEDKPLSDWNEHILSATELPCHSCKILPVCGGACPKSWHEDMRACPSKKFNIKERLALAYALSKLTDKTELTEIVNERLNTILPYNC